MNTLITTLVIFFAVFGFTSIYFVYKPILKNIFEKQLTNRNMHNSNQHEKFLKYLSPEIIDKLKSLNSNNYF